LQWFILELGYGFCFVGRQYRLVLGSKEYFVDPLFYHRFLKALVVFDVKIVAFEPEHAGKMDFYLNLLNEKERAPHSPCHLHSRNSLVAHFEDRPVSVWKENIDPAA
jgi:hypothetical protein